MFIICVSSIKPKAKKQADFSRKYSETNPLNKLDWNVTDERILFEQVRYCLGAPLPWEPGANCPCCPPSLSAALGMVILAIALKGAHFQLLHFLCYAPIKLMSHHPCVWTDAGYYKGLTKWC